MKTTTHTFSPFIILLVPVLLAIAMSLANRNTISPERFSSASWFRMPDIKGTILTIF